MPKIQGCSPRTAGTCLGKLQVPMLQLLNTSVKIGSLNANTIVPYICMFERFNYGYAVSNVVATIVVING